MMITIPGYVGAIAGGVILLPFIVYGIRDLVRRIKQFTANAEAKRDLQRKILESEEDSKIREALPDKWYILHGLLESAGSNSLRWAILKQNLPTLAHGKPNLKMLPPITIEAFNEYFSGWSIGNEPRDLIQPYVELPSIWEETEKKKRQK